MQRLIWFSTSLLSVQVRVSDREYVGCLDMPTERVVPSLRVVVSGLVLFVRPVLGLAHHIPLTSEHSGVRTRSPLFCRRAGARVDARHGRGDVARLSPPSRDSGAMKKSHSRCARARRSFMPWSPQYGRWRRALFRGRPRVKKPASAWLAYAQEPHDSSLV